MPNALIVKEPEVDHIAVKFASERSRERRRELVVVELDVNELREDAAHVLGDGGAEH